MNEGPLRLEPADEFGAFRDALRAAGYTPEAMIEIVKPLGPNQRTDVPVVKRKTESDSPFHQLVRLFALGLPAPASRLNEILGARVTEQLLRVGLLAREGDAVRSTAKLMPFQDWHILGDFGPETTGRAPREDHVLGVGAASLSLANFTVRRPCDSALDLGTGAGIQALLAAGHCRSVLGTDTNARALNFGAFNARLNGIGNVRFRAGSFYEPVRDKGFDLIVSNPPYVISPESRYIYRDSGLRGDEVCATVVRGAAGHLHEGGFAVILANWHHASADDWAEPPQRWGEGTGCDAWILALDTEAPIVYAARWLRSSGEADDGTFEGKLDEWLAYYERLGIGRISAGLVILRRVSGRANWVRADRIAAGPNSGPCGDQVLRIFEAEALLAGVKDERELLDRCYALCEEHALDHELQVEAGQWALRSARIRQTRGLGFSGGVDGYVTAILQACDGTRPLRAILSDVLGAEEAATERTQAVIADMARKLLRAGLIVATKR